MPTVHLFAGMRVVIYPNDHRPAHVHVIGSGECVFLLNCPGGPPELRENFGFRLVDLRRIEAELAGIVDDLCRKWGDLHGDF